MASVRNSGLKTTVTTPRFFLYSLFNLSVVPGGTVDFITTVFNSESGLYHLPLATLLISLITFSTIDVSQLPSFFIGVGTHTNITFDFLITSSTLVFDPLPFVSYVLTL